MTKEGYVYQVDFDCPHCSALGRNGEKCMGPVSPRSGPSHYCRAHADLTRDRARLHVIIFGRKGSRPKKGG